MGKQLKKVAIIASNGSKVKKIDNFSRFLLPLELNIIHKEAKNSFQCKVFYRGFKPMIIQFVRFLNDYG